MRSPPPIPGIWNHIKKPSYITTTDISTPAQTGELQNENELKAPEADKYFRPQEPDESGTKANNK